MRVLEQLKIKNEANKKAVEIINEYKKKLDSANQEIKDTKKKVNLWVEHAVWMGSILNSSQDQYLESEPIQSAINSLSDKEKDLLSTILLTVISDKKPLETVLFEIIEKQSSLLEEYIFDEDETFKINLN